MKRAGRLIVLVTAGILAVMPTFALAAQGWPWPLEGRVVLPYGAQYPASGGGSNTHGGLDIAGDSGDEVRSCAPGEVTFAGKVPAGEGAQAFAVTVLTADGLRITYLPLRSASVARGARISSGEAVGVLADSGDASSSRTHLHLGVRRGEARLDPAAFLGDVGKPAASAEAPEDAITPAHAPTAVSAAPVAASGSPAVGGAPAGTRALPAAQGSFAAAPQPTLSPEEAYGAAGRDVVAALRRQPELRRISGLRETSALVPERVWADARDGRTALGRVLASIGALALAGSCVVPVARAMRRSSGASTAGVALARRSAR